MTKVRRFVAIARRRILLPAVVLTLAGCATQGELLEGRHQGLWVEFSGTGTIQYRVFASSEGVDAEFGIHADDGAFYQTALPLDYQRDGLRVRFRSLRGSTLEVLEIEPLSQGGPPRHESLWREFSGTGKTHDRYQPGYLQHGILGDDGRFYYAALPRGFERAGLRVRFRLFAFEGKDRPFAEDALVVEIEGLSP